MYCNGVLEIYFSFPTDLCQVSRSAKPPSCRSYLNGSTHQVKTMVFVAPIYRRSSISFSFPKPSTYNLYTCRVLPGRLLQVGLPKLKNWGWFWQLFFTASNSNEPVHLPDDLACEQSACLFSLSRRPSENASTAKHSIRSSGTSWTRLHTPAASRSVVGSDNSTVSGKHDPKSQHRHFFVRQPNIWCLELKKIVGPWCLPIKLRRFHPQPSRFPSPRLASIHLPLPAWSLVSLLRRCSPPVIIPGFLHYLPAPPFKLASLIPKFCSIFASRLGSRFCKLASIFLELASIWACKLASISLELASKCSNPNYSNLNISGTLPSSSSNC